jgi:hypothetical protein
MLAFDNVSAVTPQQADWICRLPTGFAFRVKKLYKEKFSMIPASGNKEARDDRSRQLDDNDGRAETPDL